MKKANGKSEGKAAGLDLEHELPSSDDGSENPAEVSVSGAVPSISAETSPLEQELQKVKAERDTLLDRLARAQAEFENARKRAGKEQQEYRDYATADAIRSLLPVLDSFERALQIKSETGDFRGGVELILKQFQDALAKLGVRAVPARGELFDPHYHEAIEMVETAEAPDHQVLEELQRGYKFKDRLLRPAMVKVARNPGR
ncbi:MAG: nucleotide exchange factor GrpE [Candidatus Sulfotelmatobacter sp.]